MTKAMHVGVTAAGSPRARRGAARWLRRALVLALIAALAVTAVTVIPGLLGAPADAGASGPLPSLAETHGAAEIGSTEYPVPDDALFVASDGSDSSPGTLDAPLKTVQNAITVAYSGQTIVLRGGRYHERITITSDTTVTIQPYPGEAVWFDGSTAVTGWVSEGSVWVRDDWATVFDTSPSYTRGAPDSTQPGWNFIDPAHPLAAHPDQLWIDGTELTQVATLAEVVDGTFFVDTTASRLYLGSDPSEQHVTASAKSKAFGIQSAGSVLRGIGIRGYGTPVPSFGTVTVEAPGVTIENVVIEDGATTGLFVAAADAVVRDVTVRGNGMMGMGANYADRMLITGLLSTGNNTEHFNNAPVSGGLKMTRSRDVTVEHSSFSDNLGPGLWFDQSNADIDVLANTITGNQGHGLSLEISSRFVVAGNLISQNRNSGIKVNDTNHVDIWNNTITDNGRNLNIVQDERRAADSSIPGRDPRLAEPDRDMTWVISDITVGNNVFSGGTAECVLCVEDYSGQMTGHQMGVVLRGNIYQRAAGAEPRWLIVWSLGPGDPATYTSLKAFIEAVGEDSTGLELPHRPASDRSWLTRDLDAARAVFRRLPASIRTLLGWPPELIRVGAE